MSQIKSFLLCFVVMLFGSFSLVYADEQPEVLSLNNDKAHSALFVGNSFFYYNNGMNAYVNRLMAASKNKTPFRSTAATIGGSGLDWHPIDAYLAPNGLGRYSFVKDNEIVFNEDEKLFDLVVMMDCSQCPIHPVLSQSFYQTVEKYSAIVRAHGAEPVLFMTWAYKDKPEMIKGLSEAYVRAGNVNHALVIPAGLAFSRSIAIKPELNLYVADKRHPTLAGTYLGAAVIYASLFKRSPIGNSYWAGLDSQTALHLQTVAWETVKDFYHMTGE